MTRTATTSGLVPVPLPMTEVVELGLPGAPLNLQVPWSRRHYFNGRYRSRSPPSTRLYDYDNRRGSIPRGMPFARDPDAPARQPNPTGFAYELGDTLTTGLNLLTRMLDQVRPMRGHGRFFARPCPLVHEIRLLYEGCPPELATGLGFRGVVRRG